MLQNCDRHVGLRRSFEPFDLAFAVRVGAPDGRHPEAERQAKRYIAAALKPDGRLFIDGGTPLRDVPLGDEKLVQLLELLAKPVRAARGHSFIESVLGGIEVTQDEQRLAVCVLKGDRGHGTLFSFVIGPDQP